MRKFKAGDKVEIIGNAFTGSVDEEMGEHYFDIGTIGVIDYKLEGWGDGYFSVIANGKSWTVHAGDMAFAEEVKEHKFLDKPKSSKMDGWLVVEVTDMTFDYDLTEDEAIKTVEEYLSDGIDKENILVFAPNSNTRFEKSIKFFE